MTPDLGTCRCRWRPRPAGVSAQTDDLSLAKPYADSIWNALVKLGSIMEYTRTALEV
jgi:hypothetical protein